jgi:hypothetical protein
MSLFFSKLFRLFVVVSFLALAAVYFLPSIANTEWGRQRIVNLINRSIPGNIEIRRLELNWGKGQVIEGLLLKDPEGHSILEIDKFSTDATLIQLIRKETHLGFTQVQELNAAVITDEHGLTNIQRALGISPSPDTPRLVPSTILLSDVNADLYLFSENRPLSAVINGRTKQDNLAGSFEVNIALNGLNGKDWDSLVADAYHYLSIEGSKEARIQGRIVNFPVDLIDRIAALKKPELNGFFHALLGDRLDLSIDKEPSTEGLAFNLTVQSPFMEGGMKGLINDEAFNLMQPATLHFTLNPEAINSYLSKSVELLTEAHLNLFIEEFSVPLAIFEHHQKDNNCLFGLKGKAEFSDTDLEVASIGKVTIDGIKAAIESSQCQPTIQFDVKGYAQYARQPFEFTLASKLKKPKSLSKFFVEVIENPQASFSVVHLPLKLLPFLDSQPSVIRAIGAYADIKAAVDQSHQGDLLLNLQLETPLASLEKTQLSIHPTTHLLSLVNPTTIRWKGLNNCTDTSDSVGASPCAVDVGITAFKIPLNISDAGKHLLNVSVKQVKLPNIIESHFFQFDDFNVKIEGQSLEELECQTQGKIMLLQDNGNPSPFLREPLQLTQQSTWKVDERGGVKMSAGKLLLKNSFSKIQLNGRYSYEKGLVLSEPALASYNITPEVFSLLQKQLAGTNFILQKDANLKLEIDAATIGFKSNTSPLAQLRAKGALAIDQLSFQNGFNSDPTLNQIALPWTIDGELNAANINLTALASPSPQEKPGKLSVHIELERWLNGEGNFDLSHSKAEIQADITNLSTSASSVMLTSYNLTPLLGPVLDVTLQTLFDLDHEVPGYWTMNLDSSKFHASARFKIADELTLYDPVKPINFRWTLSPKGFEHLKYLLSWDEDRELDSSATLTGNVTDIQIPLKDPSDWIKRSFFDMNFHTDDIVWKGYRDFPIRLEGHISTEKLNDSLDAEVQVHTTSAPPSTIKGKIWELLTPSGTLKNWKEMHLDLLLKSKHLSPSFLQALLFLSDKTKLQLKAILGDLFAIRGELHLEKLSGPTSLSINGSKGTANLEGNIASGVLTLNSPLRCAITMTPLLSQVLFSNNLPLLNSGISGEHPIEITIDPDKFSLPLIPFEINKLSINKGVLNLGKMLFKNEGSMQSVLNLISPIREQQFSIWFTPIYFRASNGLVSFERLDMLIANTYSLASWGTVNYIKDQADIFLGIPAQTLDQVFGISGLDSQYLLQVPLRVRNRKVDIDSKKLAAQITALVAQKKLGSKKDLLGGVLNLVMPDLQGTSPQPTTTPFPWTTQQ